MYLKSMFPAFFLSLIINAYAAEDETDIPVINSIISHQNAFSLPEDSSQWREATTIFITPVLLPDQLIGQAWEDLLDLTMPKNGAIDTSAVITPSRRAQTIQMSYDALAKITDVEQQLIYIKGLIARHAQYIKS